MTPVRYCFIDTETTSLQPDRRIWEVAVIRRGTYGFGNSELRMFVGDVDLSHADPNALRIGKFFARHPGRYEVLPSWESPGIHKEKWKAQDVYSEKEVAVLVEELTRDATIVGAVPSFDTEGLAALLRRQGLCPTWHHRLLCVESLGASHLGLGPDGRPLGLVKLAEKLGIEHDENDVHTALGDARLAKRIFEHLVPYPSVEA